MKEKWNTALIIILIILMIIAIAIVLINPNKTEKTAEIYSKNEENISEKITTNISSLDKVKEQEEIEQSMQVGGDFCKIDDTIVYFNSGSRSIYLYDIKENSSKKILTLEIDSIKMYFDGENIYYIPNYSSPEKGIYKVDLEGNKTKIHDTTSLQLYITDDKIYFVEQNGWDDLNQNPQGDIYKMDKDGKNLVKLVDNIKNYFYINNDKIYYTTQDRKMYCIDIRGIYKEELTQGRRFAISVSEKYLLYIDYASQETEHIINLETKEDRSICNFGQIYKFEGKTYLNGRKRNEDGSLDNEYTLFEIKEEGTVIELGKIADFSTRIRYITHEKAYLYNQQEGIYTISLENNAKEKLEDESYSKCNCFLAGYGYIIDTSDLENIKIERIEL